MRILMSAFALLLINLQASAQVESRALPNLGSMNIAMQEYAGCWGYTAPNGREYALLGAQQGLQVIDITDAPNLRSVAFVNSKSKSDWTEVKTYKHYAYVVKDNAPAGIQIIDLSKLPESVSVAATIMDFPRNHTVWIDEDRGWMFTVGGDNMGVTVWTLENPIAPKQISTFNGSTYVHDMYVRGNRAYLAEIFSKSFSIYDISDINTPKLISRTRDASAPYISFHNAWTTDDGKYLLTTEETAGRPVRAWDLSNEASPKAVSNYLGVGNLAHNVHVKGNYAHIAHYGGGYRVVDIRDITKPVEVAHFNNKVGAPSGFVGVWEVYPYFPSGKVIMSSIEDGLFVTEFLDK